MVTGTITDKINNVVALLIDQCNCETPSEIKAAFQELQAALNAQLDCHCHHCDAAVVTNQIAIHPALFVADVTRFLDAEVPFPIQKDTDHG
jgi:hypothetical protein